MFKIKPRTFKKALSQFKIHGDYACLRLENNEAILVSRDGDLRCNLRLEPGLSMKPEDHVTVVFAIKDLQKLLNAFKANVPVDITATDKRITVGGAPLDCEYTPEFDEDIVAYAIRRHCQSYDFIPVHSEDAKRMAIVAKSNTYPIVTEPLAGLHVCRHEDVVSVVATNGHYMHQVVLADPEDQILDGFTKLEVDVVSINPYARPNGVITELGFDAEPLDVDRTQYPVTTVTYEDGYGSSYCAKISANNPPDFQDSVKRTTDNPFFSPDGLDLDDLKANLPVASATSPAKEVRIACVGGQYYLASGKFTPTDHGAVPDYYTEVGVGGDDDWQAAVDGDYLRHALDVTGIADAHAFCPGILDIHINKTKGRSSSIFMFKTEDSVFILMGKIVENTYIFPGRPHWTT